METLSIERIALQLERLYVAERQKKDPAYRSSDRMHDTCKRAAELCAQLNASPEEYIASQVSHCKGDFLLTLLCSSKSKKYYEDYIKDITNNLHISLSVQISYLVDQLKMGRNAEDVLMDDSIDFRPWFRIIIGKERSAPIEQKYGEAAKKIVNQRLIDFLKTKNMDVSRLL